ncbi:MAG: uncharacterized protein KVP18_000094 [Porospora cf. gigantea A]|uniref:uncharacterized protein n=1 Tax=Porospora cf. gigantea A TaxID=2853593 RepID=UPI00355953CC|nr:MAG: hypothetical protein KVP18_000094 [Porospora cf. gigantea A]
MTHHSTSHASLPQPDVSVEEVSTGLRVLVYRAFISEPTPFLQYCRTLDLAQKSIKLFGRDVLEPRATAYFSSLPYQYSRRLLPPCPIPDKLQALSEQLGSLLSVAFNSVLVNHYRSGEEYIGWHADDEKEMGPSVNDRVIATVSLGATRRFLLRPKKGVSSDLRSRQLKVVITAPVEIALHHGDLLVMRGATQTNWKHSVPKNSRKKALKDGFQDRISLTYRVCLPRRSSTPKAKRRA